MRFAVQTRLLPLSLLLACATPLSSGHPLDTRNGLESVFVETFGLE